MEQAFKAIEQVMFRIHGYTLSVYDPEFLATTLRKRLESSGVPPSRYAEELAVNQGEAAALHKALNITYSAFFRSSSTFALLEHVVLPDLLHKAQRSGRPNLRIWSAACAGGQETYSLAILLRDLLADSGADISVHIFGTDHSATAIAEAQRGLYPESALADVRLRHLHTAFTRQADEYLVVPSVRALTHFSQYDLLDQHLACPQASIYCEFDLILCCNMLFYYNRNSRSFIIDKLRSNLHSAGYLVTGDAEKDIIHKARGFKALSLPCTVFQKNTDKEPI